VSLLDFFFLTRQLPFLFELTKHTKPEDGHYIASERNPAPGRRTVYRTLKSIQDKTRAREEAEAGEGAHRSEIGAAERALLPAEVDAGSRCSTQPPSLRSQPNDESKSDEEYDSIDNLDEEEDYSDDLQPVDTTEDAEVPSEVNLSTKQNPPIPGPAEETQTQ
jgi:hypothetical protein